MVNIDELRHAYSTPYDHDKQEFFLFFSFFLHFVDNHYLDLLLIRCFR